MTEANDNGEAGRRRRKLDDIQTALGEGRPARKPQPREAGGRAITVRGNGNTIVNGDNVVHLHVPTEAPRPIVVVQTGVGVLTAAQKAEINRLFDEWFRLRNLVRKSDAEYRVLRSAFNKHMRVNRYDEILQADFDKALRWLRRQIGIIGSMASAPKKVPGWRTDRYRAINARAKEFQGGEARYRRYALDQFGTASLRELDDGQLDSVYRHVFGWPRSR